MPLTTIPSTTKKKGLFLTEGGLYTSLQSDTVIVRIEIIKIYFSFLIQDGILEVPLAVNKLSNKIPTDPAARDYHTGLSLLTIGQITTFLT